MPDGESVEQAEARLGRSIEGVMLKVKMLASYAGGATLTVTAVPVHGVSRDIEVTIPQNVAVGDVIPIDWWPHHHFPRGYYTDVTAVSGAPSGMRFQIVNDGPVWNNSVGVEIGHQEFSPYACDVEVDLSEVDSTLDGAGIGWIAYTRVGRVYARSVPNPRLTWGDEVRVSDENTYRYPRIRALEDGSLQVTAFDSEDRKTVHWRSRARGERWEFL